MELQNISEKKKLISGVNIYNFIHINEDMVKNKIITELERFNEKEEKDLRDSIPNMTDRNWDGIFGSKKKRMIGSGERKGLNRVPADLVILLAKKFNKPVDYFLYDESMFQDLVKEEFIKIPYIETFTDSENRLIYKNRYHMCAMRYDSLLKISNDPSRTILYVMDSDSMESTICKGDELLIDTTKKLVKDGAIYAFNSYDIKYIRIRRCFCEINTIQLIPDNDRKYGIYIAKNSDINIIGQVIMSKHFL